MALDMQNLLTPSVKSKIEPLLSTGDAEDIARAVAVIAFEKGWNGSLEDDPVIEMQKRTAIITLTEEVSEKVRSGEMKMLGDPSVVTTGTTARETDEELLGFVLDDNALAEIARLPELVEEEKFVDKEADDYVEDEGL